jgi:hypothetical protein
MEECSRQYQHCGVAVEQILVEDEWQLVLQLLSVVAVMAVLIFTLANAPIRRCWRRLLRY